MKLWQQNSFCHIRRVFVALGIYIPVILGYILLPHLETKAGFLFKLLLLCWTLRGWLTVQLYFTTQTFWFPGHFRLLFSLFGPSAIGMLSFLIKIRCLRSPKNIFIQVLCDIIHHWLSQLPFSALIDINSTADVASAVKGNFGRKHLVHSLPVYLGKELYQSDKSFSVWI